VFGFITWYVDLLVNILRTHWIAVELSVRTSSNIDRVSTNCGAASRLVAALSQIVFHSMVIGSLKLRYYGGRSLFGGLWEPAGERKRGGVVHVLDNFRDSQFFLIGDTGVLFIYNNRTSF
jgi:hypothetical protein